MSRASEISWKNSAFQRIYTCPTFGQDPALWDLCSPVHYISQSLNFPPILIITAAFDLGLEHCAAEFVSQIEKRNEKGHVKRWWQETDFIGLENDIMVTSPLVTAKESVKTLFFSLKNGISDYFYGSSSSSAQNQKEEEENDSVLMKMQRNLDEISPIAVAPVVFAHHVIPNTNHGSVSRSWQTLVRIDAFCRATLKI
jgi:hypothetical protein